jgi:hypothetical protein
MRRRRDMRRNKNKRQEPVTVAYGADRAPNRTYAAMFVGGTLALTAVLWAVAWFGGETRVQANNPSVETRGENASVPGAGSYGREDTGGTWGIRLNKDPKPELGRPAQTAQERGDASKEMTNCPPATVGARNMASPEAQAVEKSAVLVDAGGHDKSASPTVERQGQSVEARADCPMDPKQPAPAPKN